MSFLFDLIGLKVDTSFKVPNYSVFNLHKFYSLIDITFVRKELLIQGIHKRMVRFQKVTRNLFLTLYGHNIHRQQRQLSKFLMRYHQFASHA